MKNEVIINAVSCDYCDAPIGKYCTIKWTPSRWRIVNWWRRPGDKSMHLGRAEKAVKAGVRIK